ncbi:PIG-L deacetylase family protein [Candidatus Poriferisodalis sp.]|uniref:PIG-L deacetylase family protein n=1 Tax=Candidatus Poriferisodalis sp. TaxID=3101277 RepID=UPI003B01DFDA
MPPEADSAGTGFSVDLRVPASALVIAAHPDDAEFDCGATLAKWAAAGAVVHHFICTDGSKGTWDPECDQAALVQTRQVEQRAAAAALGATGEVRFGGHVDGELDSDLATRAQIAQVIRELQPTVVLGHDPWKRYRLHPDHRHAGLLAVEGVVAARDPFFFPEQGLPPHRPDELLLFEADEPDHAENAEGWTAAKTAALLCHRSQFVTTHDITDPDDPAQVQRFADWVDAVAVAGGQQAGLAYAELFKRIDSI